MSRYFLQHLRRILPLKQMALLFIVSVMAISAGIHAYASVSREITILDEDRVHVAKTLGMDIQQALQQMNVTIGPDDYTSVSPETPLLARVSNLFEIKRAVPMNIQVDGRQLGIMTWRGSIDEVLQDEKIVLGPMDRMVGLTLDDQVTSGMALQIVRVREALHSEFEAISYDVIEQADKDMNEGETLVAQAGVDGQLEYLYNIRYEDNRPVSRTFLEERIVSEPVERIVMFGTVKNFTSHRGDTVRYTRIMDMRSTAYTASLEDTGKAPGHPLFGVTKTGIMAREGVIAVDPRVIPLGTKVYVEVPGSAPDYGFAIAADIGSAIKGNLIDVYFDSRNMAKQWGRRSVRVYILNEQSDARWKENNTPWIKK